MFVGSAVVTDVCFFRFLRFLCLFVLCLGQFVTVIGVFWLCLIPFAAMNDVGICSLVVQRFPLAASAESGPWGSVSSNTPTGTSGTVCNVLLVIPVLLMNVSACR